MTPWWRYSPVLVPMLPAAQSRPRYAEIGIIQLRAHSRLTTSATSCPAKRYASVLFAAEPFNGQRVRSLICALATGQSISPNGRLTTRQLRSSAPDRVRPDEQKRPARLIAH